MSDRTGKYTACRCMHTSFSPEILHAGAAKGLRAVGGTPRLLYRLVTITSYKNLSYGEFQIQAAKEISFTPVTTTKTQKKQEENCVKQN